MTPYRTEVYDGTAWVPTSSVRLADSEAHALALETAASGRTSSDGVRVVPLRPAGRGDPPQRPRLTHRHDGADASELDPRRLSADAKEGGDL